MWAIYNDVVQYCKYKGQGRTGESQFEAPESMGVRLVGGYNKFSVDESGERFDFSRVYHSPRQLYEKDLLDGREVKQVMPIRGVFGDMHFYKVWVV